MAETYLSELKIVVEQEIGSANVMGKICCKHFFGGAAAYVDGQIFMTLTPIGLALKMSKEDRDSLMRRGAKPLRYFPKAPIKKDYALLPSKRGAEFGELGELIARSIAFVQKR